MGALIKREFPRDVNLDGVVADQVCEVPFDGETLRKWLQPSVDTWQVIGERKRLSVRYLPKQINSIESDASDALAPRNASP